MKKFLLTLFTLLCISASAFAAPAELDPHGFNGYKWGTDFQTIHNDVELELESRDGEIIFYVAKRKSPLGKNQNLFSSASYVFYQNRLIGGFMGADISQSKKVLEWTEKEWGKPDQITDHGLLFHYFPTTIINFGTGRTNNWNYCLLSFFSQEYFEQLQKQKK